MCDTTPISSAIALLTYLPVEAPRDVTDFGAALTGAVVSNNTLEIANGTFFLGRLFLGSKRFIRPCYKELSELLLGGASSGALRNIVVAGNSGILSIATRLSSAVPPAFLSKEKLLYLNESATGIGLFLKTKGRFKDILMRFRERLGVFG